MKKWIILAAAALPFTVAAKGGEDKPLAVTVENTPAVTIDGTPSVQLSGTPGVSIEGTASVQVTGTPSVTVANEVATDPRVRQLSVMDMTSFGYSYDVPKVCGDPADSPPCRIWQVDAPAPASLTHLSVAVGEATASGDSRCSASIVAKNDDLGIYRALINLSSQAGILRTFERAYPIPVDLSEPGTVVEVNLGREAGTGTCMLNISGFGSFTSLE